MAFLCMVDGQDGTPEVTIVYRLLKFVDSPGDEPSGFSDRMLGLLGDIMPHQYPAVEVTSAIFHLVGTPVCVPTVEVMETLIPAWEDPNVPLGPYIDTNPEETEMVRPRNSQLIPGKYAALLIHRRLVRPKYSYQEAVGAIRADNALEACADIVTWLCAACTARGGGGANNAVPTVMHQITPLFLPPEVYRYVTQKIHTDLPGIANTAGNATDTASLVGALRALTDRDGVSRARGDPKSIIEAYKETHQVLLRFCNVKEANDVSPVWERLANCHKSEQQTLLTQEMQKVCVARGLTTQLYVPVVTTTIKHMVVGFQFPGHSPDDLSTGCQPFVVAYAGKGDHLQVVAAAATADQLAQGDHNASLADIRTIREGEQIKFPLNASEVCVTLFRYAVLCETLFQGTTGAKHPFVEALWFAAKAFKDVEPFVTDTFNDLVSVHPITSIYYARIVRAVHVYSHEYLHQVSTHDGETLDDISVSDFAPLIRELTSGTFPKSTNYMDLPAEYMETAAARPPLSVAPSGAGTASTTPSTALRSDQSEVSTLSGPRLFCARISRRSLRCPVPARQLRPTRGWSTRRRTPR